MTSSVEPSANGTNPGGELPLEVRLEIEPHEEAGCAVTNHESTVTEVTQRLTQGSESRGHGEMQCEAAVTLEPSGREYLTGSTGPYCICPVFEETDCIPEMETVRDGALIVSLTVPDRSELRRIIDGLREVGAKVSLKRITQFDGDHETTVELDASEITSKQREAIEVAVAEGYYDDPRRTDLAELADRLGISKSAVSQRLNTVEAKLVRSLVEETRS